MSPTQMAPDPSVLAYQKNLRKWRNRTVRWSIASLVQLVLLTVVLLLQADLTIALSNLLKLVSWGVYTAFLVFLIVVFLRYITLLGLAFMESMRKPMDLAVQQPGGPLLPRVSVIVPAYNEEAVIDASIASLIELDYDNLEIVVIDDGSMDRTYAKAMLATAGLPAGSVRVMTQPNAGKANALNHGIAVATGEFLLCVDADSKLERDVVRKMIAPLIADPGLGAVAGAVKVANRNNMMTRLQALEYIQGLNLVRRAMSWGSLVNIIPGPIGLFRRTALDSVGMYDDDTFAEDCDLTLKLLMKGWKIIYVHDAVSWTEAPEGILDLFQQRYRWTRGILQAVLKHRQRLSFRNGIPRFIDVVVLGYMLFEAIAWPVMNVASHAFLIVLTLTSGAGTLIIVWYSLLVTLDVSIALLTLAMEEEDLSLLPYTLVYRSFFSLAVDVCKLAATVEEAIGVGMDWGKLARAGRI
jgi:biofilm PGA synthesis N-glycosyltransferase PgaC